MLCVFQLDRTRLAREKQLREEAVREKEEMERRMIHLQEEVRMAQDSLVGSSVLSLSPFSFLREGGGGFLSFLLPFHDSFAIQNSVVYSFFLYPFFHCFLFYVCKDLIAYRLFSSHAKLLYCNDPYFFIWRGRQGSLWLASNVVVVNACFNFCLRLTLQFMPLLWFKAEFSQSHHIL